jgi:hypothetical protein
MNDARADPSRPESTPLDFKTKADGGGGLIRILLVGEPHGGRSLYMDELEIPPEIYTSGAGRPFEWWPARVHEAMKRTALGSDPDAPPVRYELRIPEDTGEPQFVAAPG